MEKWFATDFITLTAIAITTVVIYAIVILYTRIFGKRSFSKMSSFDFAMTVAVGSLIATTILSHSVSLLEGMFGCFMIFAMQMLAALSRRWKPFRKAIDNSPLLLMDGSLILDDNLRKARVSEGDLRSKLREANILSLSEVKAVIFETTGDIIVIHSKNAEAQVAEWLLTDVKRK
tara:strand:+ start:117632 stop:118156 length:525 start_codon:yes stop_codon:yes gene_type:complete